MTRSRLGAPAKHAGPRDHDLSAPEWPTPVGKRLSMIGEFCATSGEHYGTVFNRLASDKRMKSVWHVVYRRQAEGDHEFAYAAGADVLFSVTWLRELEQHKFALLLTPHDPDPDETKRLREGIFAGEDDRDFLRLMGGWPREYLLQDYAASVLVAHAFYFGTRDVRTVSTLEVAEKAKRLDEIGRQLEQISLEAASLGFSKVRIHQLRTIAAEAYVRSNNRPSELFPHPLLVDRQRLTPSVRGFLLLIVITNWRLFGNPLHGTAATIANVVLGRDDITREQVREVARRIPKFKRDEFTFPQLLR